MSVWIRIEHAKRDGTRYDLWVVDRHGKGRRVADGWYSQAYDAATNLPVDDGFNGWCHGEWRPNSFNPYPPGVDGTPTHFMEIPPGPKEGE